MASTRRSRISTLTSAVQSSPPPPEFAAATTDLEQTQQRAIIRFLMEAILGQHEFLTARVKGSEATLVKSTVTRQALADFSEAINKQTGPPLAG